MRLQSVALQVEDVGKAADVLEKLWGSLLPAPLGVLASSAAPPACRTSSRSRKARRRCAASRDFGDHAMTQGDHANQVDTRSLDSWIAVHRLRGGSNTAQCRGAAGARIGVGVPKGKALGASYLRKFVDEAKSGGLVKAAIERASVRGLLAVP